MKPRDDEGRDDLAASKSGEPASGLPPASTTPRGLDALLAEAIHTFTEAARLRMPTAAQNGGSGRTGRAQRTEPVDWAEFVTLAVAGAVANMGSVATVLRGRPGSWEAASVRAMLASAVGEDPAELLRHRTEPLRVMLWPAEILADLGYDAVYDESQNLLVEKQQRHIWRYQLDMDRSWRPLDEDAPPCKLIAKEWTEPGSVMAVPRSEQDEREYGRLLDLEARTEEMRYDGDPHRYGEALRTAVISTAAELFPGLLVPIDIRVEVDVPGDDDRWDVFGPESPLIDAARRGTPLPWSGLRPHEYPVGRAVDVERAAGRLPHQRLG